MFYLITFIIICFYLLYIILLTTFSFIVKRIDHLKILRYKNFILFYWHYLSHFTKFAITVLLFA
jgi:hypothetical protein